MLHSRFSTVTIKQRNYPPRRQSWHPIQNEDCWSSIWVKHCDIFSDKLPFSGEDFCGIPFFVFCSNESQCVSVVRLHPMMCMCTCNNNAAFAAHAWVDVMFMCDCNPMIPVTHLASRFEIPSNLCDLYSFAQEPILQAHNRILDHEQKSQYPNNLGCQIQAVSATSAHGL